MTSSPDYMDEDQYTDNDDGRPEDHAGPSTDKNEDPSGDHPDLDAQSTGEPFDWQQEEYAEDDTKDQDYKASQANSIVALRE